MADASGRLAHDLDLTPGDVALRLSREMRSGFVPMGRRAAIPHLRLPALPTPRMVLVRCLDGVADPGGDGDGRPASSGPPSSRTSASSR